MEIASNVNLGFSTLFIAAASDARNAFMVELESLAIGKVALAFRHAAFLSDACLILFFKTNDPIYEKMAKQFGFLDRLSVHRNARLVQLYNEVDMHAILWSIKALIEGAEIDIKASAITLFASYVDELASFVREAKELGVNISKYISVTNDHVDVAGFKNSWCRDVQDSPVETGDLVSIVIDADNVPHVLVIVREYSPGIGQVALPGGMKEVSETTDETCLRESLEETSFATTGMTTTHHRLATLKSMTSDPRPRMSKHGSISHALLRVDTVKAVT